MRIRQAAQTEVSEAEMKLLSAESEASSCACILCINHLLSRERESVRSSLFTYCFSCTTDRVSGR